MPSDPASRPRLILALARARGWVVAEAGAGAGPAGVLGGVWEAASAGERAAFEEALAAVEGDPAVVARLLGEPGPAPSIVLPDAWAQTMRPGGGGAVAGEPVGGAEPERYQVRKEHARGGQGRVLVVLDREIGREVAMKELLPHLAQGGAAERERFLREARITGQLEHPNIVPVYEIGGAGGDAAYYTMKLVRGETMEARLRRVQGDGRLDGRRKLAERLRLLEAFLDVCNAVAYAHSRGVVNRDLKPANVMIGDFGETVVLDWGLARKVAEEEPSQAATRAPRVPGAPAPTGDTTRLTMDGDIMGTPAYMPPEQARGEIAQVDERSDVYSLGAMLYEIVAGTPPYRADSFPDLVRQILESPPPDATAVEPLAPRELAAVAAAALQKDKSRRLESARALAEEVRAWRDGRPMAVYRHTAWEQVRRFARHNRALSAALAGALVILVAGAAVSLAYARLASRRADSESIALRAAETRAEEARRAREAAEAEKKIAQGQRMAAYSTNLVAENPTAALRVAMEAARRAPGSASTNALWGAMAQLVEHRRFIGHDGAVLDGRLSPDGTLCASAGMDFTIRIWEVESGREIRRLGAHRSATVRAEWSADGTRLLTVPAHPSRDTLNAYQPPGSLDVTVRVWDTATWTCARELRGHRGALGGARWTAGGGVVTWSEDRTIRLWDAAGRDTVFEAPWFPAHVAVSPDAKRLVASRGKDLVVWDAASPQAPRRIEAHGDDAKALAWSADGAALYTGGADGRIVRRDPATLAPTADLVLQAPDPSGALAPVRVVDALLAHPDGTRVAALSHGWLTFLTPDLSRVTGRAPCEVHMFSADMLDRDWKRLLQLSGPTATLRDLATGQDLLSFRGHEYNIESVTFSADGRRVVTAARDALVIVWDTEPGACLPGYRWSAGLADFSHSRDGRYILRRLPGTAFELRDNADGAVLGSWTLEAPPFFLEFLGNSSRFVVRATDSPVLKVYDVALGHLFDADTGSAGFSWYATNDAGDRLYAGEVGKTGRIWDLTTRTAGPPFPDPKHTYDFASLSADGRLLACNQSSNLRTALFDDTGRELRLFTGHTGWTIGVAFAPGNRLLTTAMDATVRSWDLSTGAERASGRWPLVQETDIVVSPAGNVFALNGGGTARFYSVDTLDEIASLPRGLSDPAGFSADGKFAAVRRGGGFLHLPLDALAFAESMAPRDLTVLEFRGMASTRAEGDAWAQEWSRRHPRPSALQAKAERAAKEGQWDEALRLCAQARDLLPDHPRTYRAEAGLHLRRAAARPEGDPARADDFRAAGAALDAAVARGYRDVADLREAPELDPLRGLPGWEARVRAAEREPWQEVK